MKPIITLACIGLIMGNVAAQDDLLADLVSLEGPSIAEPVYATFKGSKIVNLQTVELPAEGEGQFIISHRFAALNDRPLYNLFGLDNAQIRFEYSYSPSEVLNIGMGRSSGSKTYDAYMKARLMTQQRRPEGHKGFVIPLTATWYSSMTVVTTPFPDNIEHFASDRLAYVHQLMLARKVNHALSLQLSPTLVHFNLVPTSTDRNDNFGCGLGLRYKFTNRMAFTAETYIGNGPFENHYPATSIGLDLETGGHVFQFHLTNARSMADPQWMLQNPGQWSQGDLFLGFNMSRVFNHKTIER